MKYDRVIEQTVRRVQDVLWTNLPPLSDDLTVKRIRALIGASSIQEALEHGSDTVVAFALRGVHRVLSYRPQGSRETIDRLCNILHEDALNRVLGVRPGPRV